MHINFDPKYDLFREEVSAFLAEKLTDDLRAEARLATSIFPDAALSLEWQRILHKKGWAAPNWPVEYGGTGWDPTQRFIYVSEATAAHAPRIIQMGIGMCGPAIIGFGTAEQKAHYLPKMLSTEHVWCQGYSEPGAGSDLAALTCSAVRDGDDYVVNGAKIWTTMAHDATHIFCLVRTSTEGRPQQGISFLLIDMSSPGISIKPILNLNRFHEQNSVFFDNVRVPVANLIAGENAGWTVAKYLLEQERGEVLGPHSLVDQIGVIRNAARARQMPNGATLYDDPGFRRRLAALDVDLQALVYTDHRMRSAGSPEHEPLGGASMIKVLYSELAQALSALRVEAAGPQSLVFQPDALTPGNNVAPLVDPLSRTAMPQHLNNRAASVFAGSDEVQRNIVAKSVLGL